MGIKCKEYRDPKAKKKTEIKKVRAIKKSADFLFYMGLWNERPHICSNPSCKRRLGDEFSNVYMDHILEKGDRRYKHLRYEKLNICILCSDCHSNKANITWLLELRNKTLNLFGLE